MSPPDGCLPPGQQTLVQRLRSELGEYLYLTLIYHDDSSQLLQVAPTAADALSRADEQLPSHTRP